jgi:predicted DNA repair protein MutK
MTKNRDTLEKLGRFLLRGLRIGASTVSIVELLRNDWTGGITAGAAPQFRSAELIRSSA